MNKVSPKAARYFRRPFFPTPASPTAAWPVLSRKTTKNKAGLEGRQAMLLSNPLGPGISHLALRTFAERVAQRSQKFPFSRSKRESQ